MRRMTSKTPQNCSKLYQFLKPQSSSLHLITEKPSHFLSKPTLSPSSLATVSQIVDILKSNSPETWNSNDQLTLLLSTLNNYEYIRLTRQLEGYSIVRNFVDYIHSNSKCTGGNSLSVVLQAALEISSRGKKCGRELFELYTKAKEMGVILSVNTVTHLIRTFNRVNMSDRAMLVYRELDVGMKNVHVCNVLIDGLLRKRRFDDARKVFDEMLQPESEVLADENSLDIVFYGFLDGVKGEKLVSEKEVVEMVSRFGRRGLFPDSVRLTRWISKLCKIRMTGVAWELLHSLVELGGPVEVASCNALLTGLEKAHQFEKMNVLMGEMLEKGIPPNVVTLGICINHLVKSGKIDDALELFDKMIRGDLGVVVEPDVIIYNILMNGLCKAERIEEGFDMMNRMKSESKCSPNTITYNCLIDGLCKAGQLDRSLELFDEMNKQGVEPNIITVNTIVSGMCRGGVAGNALKFYREMQEKGLDGNAVTYTTMISAFCGVNNIRKAMELLDEMKEKTAPDAIVYYTLISGLSQAGQMDEVESVLSDMRMAGFRPDIGCYNVMINGFCKKNKLDKARQLLREMGHDGVKPDSFTYNTLISYFTDKGDLKTSHTILKQMINDNVGPTVVTFGALIHACCLSGERDEAMKIFKEITTSRRVQPNTVIYNTLIDCLCRNKMVKVALSLFDDMVGEELRPDAITFNALFKGLREENWLEKALELMDRMVKQGCCPDYITLEVLTQWLPAVGETDKLKQFVEGCNSTASSLEQQEELTSV